MKKMNRLILLLLSFTLVLSSCEGPAGKSSETETDLKTSIDKLEEELFNSGKSRIDRKKALELIGLYSAYAKQNPDDELSPDYLFKAADISMNLNRPVQTIKLFDNILTTYPNNEKTPTALFLKAFVYEDQMKDYDKAREFYTLFLEKYPNNELSDDAEVSLKNLGKTPEELIREFEQNAQE